MAILVLVPCLIFMGGSVVQANVEAWAPEPLELCVVFRHDGTDTLYFNCATPDNRNIKFKVGGINKA